MSDSSVVCFSNLFKPARLTNFLRSPAGQQVVPSLFQVVKDKREIDSAKANMFEQGVVPIARTFRIAPNIQEGYGCQVIELHPHDCEGPRVLGFNSSRASPLFLVRYNKELGEFARGPLLAQAAVADGYVYTHIQTWTAYVWGAVRLPERAVFVKARLGDFTHLYHLSLPLGPLHSSSLG